MIWVQQVDSVISFFSRVPMTEVYDFIIKDVCWKKRSAILFRRSSRIEFDNCFSMKCLMSKSFLSHSDLR